MSCASCVPALVVVCRWNMPCLAVSSALAEAAARSGIALVWWCAKRAYRYTVTLNLTHSSLHPCMKYCVNDTVATSLHQSVLLLPPLHRAVSVALAISPRAVSVALAKAATRFGVAPASCSGKRACTDWTKCRTRCLLVPKHTQSDSKCVLTLSTLHHTVFPPYVEKLRHK